MTARSKDIGAGGSSPRRKAAAVAGLAVVLVVAVLFSLALGRYEISLRDMFAIITGKLACAPATWDATEEYVLLHVRLPRIAGAVLVGASLAAAGTVYQGIFRNPMVSPDILGASAGACFGAALGILLSLSDIGVELLAFAMGLLAVIIAYSFSSAIGHRLDDVLALVLSGMVVGNLFQAFTSGVKFVADPNSQLPEITFWIMGSLANVHEGNIPVLAGVFAVSAVAIATICWRLNVLSCGDDEALALGVNVSRTRKVAIIASTLLTSASVAISGMVGWVGLIIPHLTRLLVGSDHRVSVPASMLMGASFLLVVDDLCRSIYTTEIPLSILTSLIGAPLFIYLMMKSRRGRP